MSHLNARPPGLDLPIFFRRDLIAEGWNDRAISANLRRGVWTRARRGAYVDSAAWVPLDRDGRHVIRTRAVMRHSCTDVVVSHASAIPLLVGPTWGLDLSEVNVTRTDAKTGRREAGVRQHRGMLLDGDVQQQFGINVTAPTRAALEITTQASSEAALVVVNHLLRSGMTTLPLLQARYEQSMEFWPSTLKTGLVLRRANGACESVAESRFWHLCCAHHLPLPTAQFEVSDGHTLFRLDFAWPDYRFFVELDGKVKYLDPLRAGESAAEVVYREKLREDRIREITGWSCVRVTWADLENPERLLARIRAAIERAPGLTRVS